MAIKKMMAALLVSAFSVGAAHATDYPNKAVRLVVGFPPGQTTDVIARLLANELSAELGQSFYVENKPGVGATLGAAEVAHAAPDGYTLLVSSSGPLAVSPHIYKKSIRYDPLNGLQPISFLGKFPLVMVTPVKSRFSTLQDLLEVKKGESENINYASGGNGVTNHLAMELFKRAAGVEWTHIPYRGGMQALTDLVAGETDVMFEVVSIVTPFVENKQVRALGVASNQRLKPLPDVPTLDEQGFKGFNVDPWIGMLGPKGMPAEVQARLTAAIDKITSTEKWAQEMNKYGAVTAPMSSDEFGQFIASEFKKWGEAVEIAEVQIQ